ncbi:coatomer subunit zeta-2 isoform X1 [Paramormyrops kingsleyae]|uniref:coatomer subunit zeta-2 isoform X1 n=1 Tax=Paramormyrops kingsleyae TaxID=1676925 RepID=UPI000CD65B38|nr:coatomer subunit zeta-2 isoform X1 [Paramormyrops kingsleyae]
MGPDVFKNNYWSYYELKHFKMKNIIIVVTVLYLRSLLMLMTICMYSQEPSLYTVKAVLILDNDGNRLLSKYYDTELYPSIKEQKNFEKSVFNKSHKADNEIAFLEGLTIVYKSSVDLFFYVVGSAQENELMLMMVLNCLFDTLSQILRKNVEKRYLLDNLDGVYLVVDEIIDGGIILESDPQQVIQKVNYRVDENPLSEQSVAQVLQSAKEQIKWSILK